MVDAHNENLQLNLNDALDDELVEKTRVLFIGGPDSENDVFETTMMILSGDDDSECSVYIDSGSETMNMFDRTCVLIENEEQFEEEINECMTIYDFSTSLATDLEGKKNKEYALGLLTNYVENSEAPFTQKMHEQSIAMFKKNCIRMLEALPMSVAIMEFEAKTLSPLELAELTHLQLVYDFFLSFIESEHFQVEIGAQYIGQKFIMQFLVLFNSTNIEEREVLKTILHQIYSKFVPLRPFIRQEIKHIFMEFVHEKKNFNGIAELLSFFGYLVNGFSTPLKDEHLTFLKRVIMPLHKVPLLSTYQSKLIECIMQFIKKDPKLSRVVIESLLKYWPYANYRQEYLFLNELDEFLDTVDLSEIKSLAIPIFKRVALCISSNHVQTVERTLVLWISIGFSKFLNENIADALPILLPPLVGKTTHWDKTISAWSSDSLRKLSNCDQELYDLCMKNYEKKDQTEAEHREKRDKLWEAVHRQAELNEKNTFIDD